MEIERQFLVTVLPPLPNAYDKIRQGYVSLLPEIRIRQIGDSNFTLTVKRGTGLVREEWETEISRKEFENLAERLHPGTLMIEKSRYHIPLADGLIAELHIHEGHLTGFNYVEVADNFEPPSWFGREVTEDARFSYGTLAKNNGIEIVKQIMRDG